MKFIETPHIYQNEHNHNYLSVTTLIKNYTIKEDWIEIAKKKALKENRNYEELLAEWEEKRNKSAEKGTRYHKLQEELLINKKHIDYEGCKIYVKHVPTIDGIKEDSNVLLNNNEIYPEKLIWSDLYKICGTADLVKVYNNIIYIDDYKTNEKLDFESFKHPNPRIGKKKMLFPLSHLDDCNFNHYQLQLNIYMYLLLQTNRHLKMGHMTILHIKFNENDEPLEPIKYKVKNMQKEVATLLKHYKSTVHD